MRDEMWFDTLCGGGEISQLSDYTQGDDQGSLGDAAVVSGFHVNEHVSGLINA